MRLVSISIFNVFALSMTLVVSTAGYAVQPGSTPTAGTHTATDAATRLHQIFNEEWQRTLRENPTQASQLGDRRYNTLWPDISLTAIRTSQATTRQVLATLKSLDRSKFSVDDQLNARLFEYQYEAEISEQQFRLHLLPINQRGGIQD